jgi:hypothetical protein
MDDCLLVRFYLGWVGWGPLGLMAGRQRQHSGCYDSSHLAITHRESKIVTAASVQTN